MIIMNPTFVDVIDEIKSNSTVAAILERIKTLDAKHDEWSLGSPLISTQLSAQLFKQMSVIFGVILSLCIWTAKGIGFS